MLDEGFVFEVFDGLFHLIGSGHDQASVLEDLFFERGCFDIENVGGYRIFVFDLDFGSASERGEDWPFGLSTMDRRGAEYDVGASGLGLV